MIQRHRSVPRYAKAPSPKALGVECRRTRGVKEYVTERNEGFPRRHVCRTSDVGLGRGGSPAERSPVDLRVLIQPAIAIAIVHLVIVTFQFHRQIFFEFLPHRLTSGKNLRLDAELNVV